MHHSYMTVSSEEGQRLRIHYVEERPENPERLLILLHGFSQFWYVWQPYLLPLSQMGFHVVAPDMRGFNGSDKPHPRSAYEMKWLVNDVLEMVRRFGYDRVTVIGHDWGGSIVWELAQQYPGIIEAAVVINAPHRGAYAANIRRSPLLSLSQTLRSWYIYFFQLPYLPEWVMRCCDFAWLEHNFRSWATKEGAFSDEDIEAYKAALRIPGALRSTINYYRANTFGEFGMGVVKAAAGRKEFGKTGVPSLLIWGDRDLPLDKRLTKHMERFFSAPFRSVHIEDGSHWVLQEHFERILDEIGSFLKNEGAQSRNPK